jgi:hypothetical protein
MKLFTPPDTDAAFEQWGANCGPCALAALLSFSLDRLRHHLPGFENRRYMNPTHMLAALSSLRVRVDRTTEMFPDRYECGLVFIQWGGPWLKPGVPVGAAYRNTHWIAVAAGAVYDVNVGHWVSRSDWIDPTEGVGAELAKHVPRCDGTWKVRKSLIISPSAVIFPTGVLHGN